MKEFFKWIVRSIGFVIILPIVVSFRLRALLIGADRSLQSSTQFLSLLPGLSGQYIRRAFLARALHSCDSSCCIEFGTIFSRTGARIGKNSYIGPYCVIGLADIGSDALLAPGVQVPSGQHTHGTDDASIPIRDQEGRLSLVKIGEGSWVGCSAVIMADIGKNSIIAAGSVVTKPIPDYSIAAGSPARVIRSRVLNSANNDNQSYVNETSVL
jgi:virginiamycin A acetyltransferase